MVVLEGEDPKRSGFGFEKSGWGQRTDLIPETLHAPLAVARAHELDGHVLIMEVGIEQRDIEMLPLAGAFAMEQGGRHCRIGVHTRRDIADRERRRKIITTLFAAQISNTGIGLADKIVARLRGERS